MSLFATAPVSRHLVEFNAGKCVVEGSWIKPDTRKGQIYMDQSDDQLLHFYWKERKNQSTPEDDLIIFPDEAEFIKVAQCTTGRVYLLKFKTSNEHHFYWMQSKNDEKDQEVVDRVNELIRDPEANMNMTSEMDESASHAELLRLLNGVENQDPNITPENLLQFLNSMNGSHEDHEDEVMEEEHEEVIQNETETADSIPTTTTAAAAATDASIATATDASATTEETTSGNTKEQPSSEQLDQLRQILANVTPNSNATPISLTDVLTSQTLTHLLNDPEMCASLFPFLPEETERSAEEVKQVVRSPQFSQALQSLSAALHTGQLGPLLTQLGLDPSAGNSVESFLIAISEQAKKKKKDSSDAMDED